MVNVGDIAPDFELVDTELKMRKLEEFAGKNVVIAFFVAASSPVCETELCSFRDSSADLKGLDSQVVAISNDGPFANKAFAEKNNISFPVLGDYTSNTIKNYGVLMPDLLHIKDYNAAKRSIFIVTKDGKIGYKWVSEDPLKEPDYAEIREFLSTNKV